MRDAVLRILQQHKDHYISGEAISGQLHITRAAVWKHIHALKEDGFVIDSAPRRGYRLVQAGNTLHAAQIAEHLSTHMLGRSLTLMQSAPSTNLVAKALAAEDCPHGTAVLAEEQTEGRGRLGRGWVNTPGLDICVSLVLRPAMETRDAPRFTLGTALGVARLATGYGLPASIKWPNDVLIGNKKICGILLELSGNMDRLDAIIVGLGLNVNTPSFPPAFEERATSLAKALGHPLSRAEVLGRLLNHLEPIYNACAEDAAFPAILNQYRSLCGTIGQEIDVHGLRGSLHGIAEGIDPTGQLLLRTGDGALHTLFAGDISLRGQPTPNNTEA